MEVEENGPLPALPNTRSNEVEACIQSLLNNEITSLSIVDVLQDDEGDLIDSVLEENVGAEIVRIADALSKNESVEDLYLEALGDADIVCVTKEEALKIGLAIKKRKKAFARVRLEAEFFEYDSKRMAIIVSALARNSELNEPKDLSLSIIAYGSLSEHEEDAQTELISALQSLMLSNACVTDLSMEGLSLFDQTALEFARSLAKQRDHLKTIKVINSDSIDTNCRISCSFGHALCESIGPDTEVQIELSIFEDAPDCHPLEGMLGLQRNIKRFVLNNFLLDDNNEPHLSDSALDTLALASQNNKSAANVELRCLGGNGALMANVMTSLVSPGFVSELEFCDCHISSVGVAALSNALKGCSNSALRLLRFDYCRFGDNCAKALGLGLEGNKNLTRLDIFQGEVTDVGMRYLSEGILKSSLKSLDMQENWFEFRCHENLKNLLCPSSPLQDVRLAGIHSLRSTELKVVFDALDANHTMRSVHLPCEATTILDHKERISNLLRTNSSLKEFNLKDSVNRFTGEQTEEIIKSLAPSLLVNHSLRYTNLVGYDDNAARRLLNLNRKGVIAAAAGKGVSLPSSFVKGLPDSAVPDALKKVNKKGRLTGTFSFLQQIHFGNLIAANIDDIDTKKRPAEK